jgi:hypothetical protein
VSSTATLSATSRPAGWFANRPLAMKFTILIGVVVLVLGAVITSVLVGASAVAVADRRLADLTRAGMLVLQLDSRASELKVDGYEAVVRKVPAEQLPELADDRAAPEGLLAGLAEIELTGEAAATEFAEADLAAATDQFQRRSIIITLVGLLAVLVISWATLRSIQRPVGQVAASLDAARTALRGVLSTVVVSSAAEEVRRNVPTVAAGAEQMGAVIRSIAVRPGGAGVGADPRPGDRPAARGPGIPRRRVRPPRRSVPDVERRRRLRPGARDGRPARGRIPRRPARSVGAPRRRSLTWLPSSGCPGRPLLTAAPLARSRFCRRRPRRVVTAVSGTIPVRGTFRSSRPPFRLPSRVDKEVGHLSGTHWNGRRRIA